MTAARYAETAPIAVGLRVAIFGAVFLHSVDNNLPSDLEAAGVAPARAEEVTAAARHFVAAGSGEEQAISEEGVVNGFLALSVAGLGIVTLATVSAFFIKYRPHTTQVHTPAVARAAKGPAEG